MRGKCDEMSSDNCLRARAWKPGPARLLEVFYSRSGHREDIQGKREVTERRVCVIGCQGVIVNGDVLLYV